MNNKSTKWLDSILMIASLLIMGLSARWMIQSGTFDIMLGQDEKLAWHLVRSAGMVSYILLLASTIWGLFISSQFVKNWSPGPVSLTLHSTISWLALIIGLTHGLLLHFDGYFSYTLGDILIPFTGPYRPLVVGLGTLAFWMLLIISLSFPIKKYIGHKSWKLLHYMSYIAFGMVTFHGLLAGTDSHLLGFRILIGIGNFIVVSLLIFRMAKDRTRNTKTANRRTTSQRSQSARRNQIQPGEVN